MKYKYSEIISGLASGFSNLIFRWLLIGSVFVVAFQSATRVDAADQIITRDQTLFGEIDSVSTQAVRFIPRGSTKSAQEIDVTDVVMVQFSGEPQALVESKKRLVENDFVGALEAIEQVSKDDIQSESVAIRGEYAYVRAAATLVMSLCLRMRIYFLRSSLLKKCLTSLLVRFITMICLSLLEILRQISGDMIKPLSDIRRLDWGHLF